MTRYAVAALGMFACLTLVPPGAAADPVTDWNANAGKAALAACISPIQDPLHESRLYAMMHLAIHDALNAIDRRSRPYAFRRRVASWVSPDAAVASAARHVLVPLLGQLPSVFPPPCGAAGIASVEADYQAALDGIPDGNAKTVGISLGRAAAEAILAMRAHDGSDTPFIDPAYPQGTQPGEYRFTPGFDFALAPGWGEVTPFALERASEFRARRPIRLSSDAYTEDFDEVKALGGDGATTPSARTPDQTEIALFWIESSPLQWNRIARAVAASRGIDAWESARLFGLLNVALTDGYIGAFESKYKYNFWRPITAIRAADTDGNDDTAADPAWTPLAPTPPIPDHDSGHSVEGGAAAQVLKRFFGTDRVAFSACSLTLPPGQTCFDASPVFRSYATFSEAAAENGLSRILVGYHFRRAVTEGIRHGRDIGNATVDRILQPRN
jgi:hypothetical protein